MKFLLAAALLVAVATAQTNCGGYTSCATCTPVGGCGWCSYNNVCEAGNQTGSFVGCTGTYWTWSVTYCPATPAPASACSSFSSCSVCTTQGSCGWCSFNNQCQQGNATGSTTGCTTPYWSWTSNQCAVPTPAPTPVNTCGQYTTCGTCTVVGSCGFCLATGVCQLGNATGSWTGTCTGSSWAWTSNQCTVTPTPVPTTPSNSCGNYYSCATCTAAQNCGFCSWTNTCQFGNATGPIGGSCANSYWQWTSGQCTVTSSPAPVSACNSYTTCYSCTAVSNCGWCATTAMCSQGTSTGPNVGSCSNWDWTNNFCSAAKKA